MTYLVHLTPDPSPEGALAIRGEMIRLLGFPSDGSSVSVGQGMQRLNRFASKPGPVRSRTDWEVMTQLPDLPSNQNRSTVNGIASGCDVLPLLVK